MIPIVWGFKTVYQVRMFRMRRIVAIFILLTVSGCGNDSVSSPAVDQTGGGLLPAGKYVGTVNMPTTSLQSQWQYNPVTGSGSVVPQAVATIVPSPFAGGDMDLDGKGNYTLTNGNASTKFGVYRLLPGTNGVTFESGPFANCTATIEQADGATRLNVSIQSPDAKQETLEVHFSQDRQK